LGPIRADNYNTNI